jgi:ABC-type antimicrobial peptide transport system permease subunit
MKALGFTPNTVLCLIVGEAVWLGAIGGLVGLCGAQVMIAGMRTLPAAMVSLASLSLSAGVMAITLLLAGACGFFAALPAAWRGSRRSIIECLRQAD